MMMTNMVNYNSFLFNKHISFFLITYFLHTESKGKALIDILLDSCEDSNIQLTEEELREQVDTFIVAVININLFKMN